MSVIATKRTEKEYRALELDSYSSLALFAKDRRQYYKKIYMGEKPEDDDNKAIMMGQLVESLLPDSPKEDFDNKFYMSSCTEPPTGNNLKFVNELYKSTVLATNGETGELQEDFKDLCIDAYKNAGIKKPGFEKFMIEFVGSNSEDYYKEIRASRPNNLQVVCIQDIDNAQKIVNELQTNPITADIINQKNSNRFQVMNQLQIDGFQIDGLDLKSMLDKVIIDHTEKGIQFYDLKCVWNVEEFYENYYLYRKAFIQSYVYHKALIYWAEQNGYGEYFIHPPKFIVCDSINYLQPIIYETDVEDLFDAYNGFEYKGKTYVGVKSLIEDLKWAKDNNQWRISRVNSMLNGVVKLKK